jgi:hypothetical protein
VEVRVKLMGVVSEKLGRILMENAGRCCAMGIRH